MVLRRITPLGRMEETYTTTNRGATALSLAAGDLGVRTPLWCGGSTAYVCATQMGAAAPHLGLVLTRGRITGYTINDKHSSDDRGLISLCPATITLAPGQSRTISWTLFWHRGWSDFFAQADKIPAFTRLEASRYTFSLGETIDVTTRAKLQNAQFNADGRLLPIKRTSLGVGCVYRPARLGEHMVRLTADGHDTFLRIFVTPPPMDLIRNRVLFIVHRQQRNAPGTPLDGAYFIYDNDANVQIHEDVSDHNAGRERVGMAGGRQIRRPISGFRLWQDQRRSPAGPSRQISLDAHRQRLGCDRSTPETL